MWGLSMAFMWRLPTAFIGRRTAQVIMAEWRLPMAFL